MIAKTRADHPLSDIPLATGTEKALGSMQYNRLKILWRTRINAILSSVTWHKPAGFPATPILMNYPRYPRNTSKLGRVKQIAEELNALRVSKRLSIGQRGTTKWLERFGEKLVCVRYREDPRTGERYTTVELIVDNRPPKPSTRFLVEIKGYETGLRQKVKEHGGTWDQERKLWLVSHGAILCLGLGNRIVEKLPLVEAKR